MSKQVDLDDVERKASRLVAASRRVAEHPRDEVTPYDAVSELGLARHEYSFSATAPVVLALIARIRELEAALGDAAGGFEAASSAQSRSEYADSLRALLAKGTAIP